VSKRTVPIDTPEVKKMNDALKKTINGISVAIVFLNLALVVLKLTKTVTED
jgi:hypothetical protein